MNEIEKDLFHAEINGYPYWVKDFNGLNKYSRHLCFRLKQKTYELEKLMELVRERTGENFDEWLAEFILRCELSRDWEEEYKNSSDELQNN